MREVNISDLRSGAIRISRGLYPAAGPVWGGYGSVITKSSPLSSPKVTSDLFITMAPPFLSTPEEYKTLFDSVDTFLLDCDGVIYHGPEVVPGVKTVLQMMRDAGES